MKMFITILAIATFFIVSANVEAHPPTVASATCPNCQPAQYVQTIKLAPWNWGSHVIRLRRVRPPVTLQVVPQGHWQLMPAQPPAQPQAQ